MRFSTEIVLATCLSTVMAGPHHLHRHRDVHAKKDYNVDWSALDWNNMGIDWASAYAEGQKTKTSALPTPPAPTTSATATASPIIAAAKPETTTAAPPKAAPQTSSPAPSSSAESGLDTVVSDLKTLFSGIVGLANHRTSFGSATSASGSEIGKIGNIGSPEASNMLLVSSTNGYDFTNTFINTQSKPITIVVWNKAATNPQTGVVDANIGSCLALTSPALSFTLAPNGGKQIVAFQDDTQLGFAEATSAKTPAGAPDTTWGECNFSSSGSGFDVSSIVNSKGNTYDMSMSVSENSCVSDMTQNDWIAKDGNPEDPIPVGGSDGSCFVPGSTMHITTKMGGDV